MLRPAGYYVERAWQYQAAVIAGTEPSCVWVRRACERNARDFDRANAGESPWHFDITEAERPCRSAEQFPHIKGPKAKLLRWLTLGLWRWRWQTIELEPWQCWIVCVLFGWLRDDGTRRFRTALLMVPRKNAKTTLAAVLCLHMLTADGEVGADVYSAATKKDQARIVYDMASKMARRVPQFLAHFGVVILERELKVDATGSQFSPLSADDKTLDGLNPSFAVVDELHAHRTRGVWDVLVTALGSRAQPMLLAISTAGTSIGGICHEVLTYGHKVLQGVFDDDEFFCINYTIDEADREHWDDEAVMRKANPNWGVSVNPAWMLAQAKMARRSPAAINNFLTKHLNVWVRAVSPWMPLESWNACADERLTLEDLVGAQRIVVTVDLAEVNDIASIVATALYADGTINAVGKHFYPERAVETSPVAQLSGWVHDGWITQTPGDVHDFSFIEDEAVRIFEAVGAHEIGFDRALAAQMTQNMQKRVGEDVVIVIPQNVATFNPAMKDLTGRVRGARFRHQADPVLTWMISNVGVKKTHMEEDYPVKAGGKDSPEKIDGAIALLMGVARILTVPEAQESVYDREEMRTV